MTRLLPHTRLHSGREQRTVAWHVWERKNSAGIVPSLLFKLIFPIKRNTDLKDPNHLYPKCRMETGPSWVPLPRPWLRSLETSQGNLTQARGHRLFINPSSVFSATVSQEWGLLFCRDAVLHSHPGPIFCTSVLMFELRGLGRLSPAVVLGYFQTWNSQVLKLFSAQPHFYVKLPPVLREVKLFLALDVQGKVSMTF